MQTTETMLHELQERYETLRQSATWCWMEGDLARQAAIEQRMSSLWEKLQELLLVQTNAVAV